MAPTPLDVDVAPLGGAGADLVSAVAGLSKDELGARMTEALRVKTAAEGEFTICLAESLKRMMFRDDGATSVEAWTAEQARAHGLGRCKSTRGRTAEWLPSEGPVRGVVR